jgi:hypothetical protein
MGVFDKVAAGLTLAVCLVLMVRLGLSPRLRRRFDGWALHSGHTIRRFSHRLLHWRATRNEAARAAEEAIERARRGSWDGNVYSPKSFRKPRKPH